MKRIIFFFLIFTSLLSHAEEIPETKCYVDGQFFIIAEGDKIKIARCPGEAIVDGYSDGSGAYTGEELAAIVDENETNDRFMLILKNLGLGGGFSEVKEKLKSATQLIQIVAPREQYETLKELVQIFNRFNGLDKRIEVEKTKQANTKSVSKPVIEANSLSLEQFELAVKKNEEVAKALPLETCKTVIESPEKMLKIFKVSFVGDRITSLVVPKYGQRIDDHTYVFESPSYASVAPGKENQIVDATVQQPEMRTLRFEFGKIYWLIGKKEYEVSSLVELSATEALGSSMRFGATATDYSCQWARILNGRSVGPMPASVTPNGGAKTNQ